MTKLKKAKAKKQDLKRRNSFENTTTDHFEIHSHKPEDEESKTNIQETEITVKGGQPSKIQIDKTSQKSKISFTADNGHQDEELEKEADDSKSEDIDKLADAFENCVEHTGLHQNAQTLLDMVLQNVDEGLQTQDLKMLVRFVAKQQRFENQELVISQVMDHLTQTQVEREQAHAIVNQQEPKMTVPQKSFRYAKAESFRGKPTAKQIRETGRKQLTEKLKEMSSKDRKLGNMDMMKFDVKQSAKEVSVAEMPLPRMKRNTQTTYDTTKSSLGSITQQSLEQKYMNIKQSLTQHEEVLISQIGGQIKENPLWNYVKCAYYCESVFENYGTAIERMSAIYELKIEPGHRCRSALNMVWAALFYERIKINLPVSQPQRTHVERYRTEDLLVLKGLFSSETNATIEWRKDGKDSFVNLHQDVAQYTPIVEWCKKEWPPNDQREWLGPYSYRFTND